MSYGVTSQAHKLSRNILICGTGGLMDRPIQLMFLYFCHCYSDWGSMVKIKHSYSRRPLSLSSHLFLFGYDVFLGHMKAFLR